MSASSGMGLERSSRFAPHVDWFVCAPHQGVHATRVWAVAERVVDYFHALTAHLDPAVDLWLRDTRTGECWCGELLALPDVRETLGRLRLPLATYGGVECAVYTSEDQLTLTPDLLLIVYARTTRWSFLLDGMGLTERSDMPAAQWESWSAPRAEAPPLSEALAVAVARLGLVRTAA